MLSKDDSGESTADQGTSRARYGRPDDGQDQVGRPEPEPWRAVASRLSELASRPVLVLGADNRVLLANDEFARLTGLEEPALLDGLLVTDLMAVDLESWGADSIDPQEVTFGSDRRSMSLRGERVEIEGSDDLSLVWLEATQPTSHRSSSIEPEMVDAQLTDRDGFAAAIRYNLEDPNRRSCGLLLVDVERFETISDALGQPESDRVLLALIERLLSAIGAESVACRFAGHEVAILTTTGVDHARVLEMAQSIISAVHEPFVVDQRPVTTRVNVGGTVGGERSTVESMLREADVALSHARAEGVGIAIFDERLRNRLDEMSRFEGELRLALAAGRMDLHYQPEVDLETGRAVGVEALVRWPHPVLGVVPADHFVEITEVTGMAAELGRWVLGEACSTLAGWTHGRSLSMNVNVSAAQLAGSELADEVASVLAETGVRPERLCLEITETSVMTDLDRSLTVLEQLTDLGVQLAIDDFRNRVQLACVPEGATS